MNESKFTINEFIEIQKSLNTDSTPRKTTSNKLDHPTFANNLNHPYKIGEQIFIRTVTLYYVGILLAVYEQELVLTKASWIADTGKFSKAIIDGVEFEEIEPFIQSDQVIIGRGGIIDCSVYKHTLPSKQK